MEKRRGVMRGDKLYKSRGGEISCGNTGEDDYLTEIKNHMST